MLESTSDVFETSYAEKAYERLRAMARELQFYDNCLESQLAELIGWNVTSLNRFMNGHIKTMPHHIAQRLQVVYGAAEPNIRAKKQAHEEALKGE